MGKLKIIYLTLLNRKEKILKKEDVIRLIEEYNKKFNQVSVKNALWYLSRQNYLKRIFLDYYYINSIEERERDVCHLEDKERLFAVLNTEKIKWYLGLTSALYELGETWQVPNRLTIINTKLSGERKIAGMKIKFIKIKDNLIFGLLSNKTKNGFSYFYSNVEKTRLDFAYLERSINLIKNKKTKEYLKNYPLWLQKLI